MSLERTGPRKRSTLEIVAPERQWLLLAPNRCDEQESDDGCRNADRQNVAEMHASFALSGFLRVHFDVVGVCHRASSPHASKTFALMRWFHESAQNPQPARQIPPRTFVFVIPRATFLDRARYAENVF